MGAVQDEMALADQEKLDRQAAAHNAQRYNPDGSATANDLHMPKLPQSGFPADLTGGSGFRVNRDQLTRVAGHMHADLARLQSALQALNNSGAGGATLAGWETADALGNNAGQAYFGISTFLQELHDAYDQVIGYLHQTAINYGDAEAATVAAARQVGTGA